MVYSFKGQSAPEINTKFVIKMSLNKIIVFPEFVHYRFLHFNDDYAESTAAVRTKHRSRALPRIVPCMPGIGDCMDCYTGGKMRA